MRAVILAGGGLTVTPYIRRISQATIIIAADSGLRHARTLGLTPTLTVGDFDSASAEDLATFKDVPVRQFSTDKDYLDLEIAIQEALNEGATELRLLGALGSRLDQSLAALFIAARLKSAGITLSLHGGTQDVFLLSHEDRLELPLAKHQLFSLLSITDSSVLTLANARYPLTDFTLDFGVGLGVSNRVAASPLRLTLASGLVALIVERGEDVA